MVSAIRLIVAVRQLTGAGGRGFTRLPSGSTVSRARKQPPLLGIRDSGSVTERSAKHAAAYGPDAMQLNGPRTCGDVPVKSQVQVLATAGYRGYYCFEWEKKWHPEIEEPEVAFPHFARTMTQYLEDAGVKPG
jgi:hypothetical protein